MRLLQLTFVLLVVMSACTDEVSIDSGFEEAQPVVDAWLTDRSSAQTINLSFTQDYFSNAVPPPLEGAEVVVCQTELGNACFAFEETSPGVYVWLPTGNETLGVVGERFALSVKNQGQEYIATSQLNRVPDIDSISIVFEEEQLGLEEGLYAQLYARDLPGVGDRYLIRSTINDTLLNRPSEINIAFDASFDGGTATDGLTFIFPIRASINKIDDDGSVVPLELGDVVEVEIWSLTAEAYDFLSNAAEQILNSNNQLFSVPVVSTRGNVTNAGTGDKVLGVFNISAVSSALVEVE